MFIGVHPKICDGTKQKPLVLVQWLFLHVNPGMSVVALVKCDSYAYSQVYPAVKRGIQLLGGVNQFAMPSEKILIKPNLLTGAEPDRCITTHPSVFRAVVELFKEGGVKVSYGDGPGVASGFLTAAKAGLEKVAKETAIEFADFSTFVERSFPLGRIQKKFMVAKAISEHDGVISLPKFKTHSLTRITGCVKNQFGCIPFLEKRKMHARLTRTEDFAGMLLDLNQCIKPRLYVMDSIHAMEGNGPAAGTPFNLNVLGFSADPIALDATMCRIICLDPSLVPTVYLGNLAGYGVSEENQIRLAGDNLESFRNSIFKVNRSHASPVQQASISGKLMLSLIRRPFILTKKCIRCGACIQACPVEPKAIRFTGKENDMPPEINEKQCIRCYCCHEICTEKAIELRLAPSWHTGNRKSGIV